MEEMMAQLRQFATISDSRQDVIRRGNISAEMLRRKQLGSADPVLGMMKLRDGLPYKKPVLKRAVGFNVNTKGVMLELAAREAKLSVPQTSQNHMIMMAGLANGEPSRMSLSNYNSISVNESHSSLLLPQIIPSNRLSINVPSRAGYKSELPSLRTKSAESPRAKLRTTLQAPQPVISRNLSPRLINKSEVVAPSVQPSLFTNPHVARYLKKSIS